MYKVGVCSVGWFVDSDSDTGTMRVCGREDVLLLSIKIYSAKSSMDHKFTFSRYGNRKSTETIKQKVVKCYGEKTYLSTSRSLVLGPLICNINQSITSFNSGSKPIKPKPYSPSTYCIAYWGKQWLPVYMTQEVCGQVQFKK